MQERHLDGAQPLHDDVHYPLRRREACLSATDDPSTLPAHFVQPAVDQREPSAAMVDLIVLEPRGHAVP